MTSKVDPDREELTPSECEIFRIYTSLTCRKVATMRAF